LKAFVANVLQQLSVFANLRIQTLFLLSEECCPADIFATEL